MAKNSYTYQEILLGMLVNYTKIVKLDKYVTDLSNQIKLTLSMTVPLALWLHFGVLSQLYCQTISLVVDNPFCDLLYVSCVSPTLCYWLLALCASVSSRVDNSFLLIVNRFD